MSLCYQVLDKEGNVISSIELGDRISKTNWLGIVVGNQSLEERAKQAL